MKATLYNVISADGYIMTKDGERVLFLIHFGRLCLLFLSITQSFFWEERHMTLFKITEKIF